MTGGKVTVEGVDLAKMSGDQKSLFRVGESASYFKHTHSSVLTALENVGLPFYWAAFYSLRPNPLH